MWLVGNGERIHKYTTARGHRPGILLLWLDCLKCTKSMNDYRGPANTLQRPHPEVCYVYVVYFLSLSSKTKAQHSPLENSERQKLNLRGIEQYLASRKTKHLILFLYGRCCESLEVCEPRKDEVRTQGEVCTG